jgi:aryl-alcohol dehydrogenase-like predicted oxidoreductase
VKYRELGRTGRRVSTVGVGTWQFGGEWGRAFTQREADAILDRAAACGINLIDTAECYGDHLSERLIGDYLARRDRSAWIVATKFGHRYHGFMNRTWHLSAAEVRAQLEASLRALRTDVIDLYQFHSGSDEQFENEELWTMLRERQRAGQVRHLGLSIAGAGHWTQVKRATAVGAGALQIVYNRLDRRPETEAFPTAEREGLGILARVPLASGFLSGKYRPGAVFSGEDVRATHKPENVRRQLEEVERIAAREVPPGVPMARWALAWCLRRPVVSAVIPGCKSPEQVADNAAAADLQIADDR